LLDQSIAEYRKAEAIKPGQTGVVLDAVAKALEVEDPIPRSGKALTAASSEKDKTLQAVRTSSSTGLLMFKRRPPTPSRC